MNARKLDRRRPYVNTWLPVDRLNWVPAAMLLLAGALLTFAVIS